MKLNIQLFADGEVIIPVNLDTKSFDKQIAKLEYDLEELEETYKLALKDPDWDEKDLKKMEFQIEQTKNKIIGLQKQQMELNQTTKQYDSSFKNVGSKLTKMGLAVFGIRSAFMLVRQSMNQIAQDNDILANKLNTIKGALATAIAPIAEGLVNIVYKLLAYLNVITKTFLGIDLFKKSAKSSKQTYQNAKKLSKTMAGFDEMNVLNDNTSQAGGGGGSIGGLKIEEPDTSTFEKVVEKFKKMWNDILEIDRDEAQKLFDQSYGAWGTLALGIFDWTQGWVKIFQGVFDTIKGIWGIVVGWATDDNKKIQNGVKNVKKSLIKILEGFGQVLIAPWEMVWGFIKGIVGTIWKWVNDKLIKPITDKIDKIKNQLKDNFKEGFWKGILNTFIDIFNKVINKLNDKLTISISPTTRKILSAIGVNVPSGGYSLFKIPNIPKLARGGIVNMPSRGIPVGNAIAGEKGAEGVIPLTDSQQMALLGEAIGRFITINAQITNTMNGRVISRELQKIQQENSFASNR